MSIYSLGKYAGAAHSSEADVCTRKGEIVSVVVGGVFEGEVGVERLVMVVVVVEIVVGVGVAKLRRVVGQVLASSRWEWK